MKIILTTQGSQGVVTLRELFGLGFKPNEIVVLVCKSRFNATLLEFLEFNKIPIIEIGSGKEFDSWLISGEIPNKTILLSVSWKYKFSKQAIRFFGNNAINLHPGLLPEYKGCFSSSWSIINGEKVSGFTYHLIDDDFDCGEILLREEIPILDNDTAHSLNYKIMQKALSKIGEVLALAGLPGERQCEIGQYYSSKIPFGGELRSEWSSEFKERFIRAIYFPPHDPAYEVINGQIVFKIP